MDSPKLRLTLADYEGLLDLPENRERLFELIDGELIEKMGSYEPSHIAGLIVTFLNLYLFENPIGHTTVTDGAYRMAEDTVFMPDVGYIAKGRLPQKPPREVPVPPDLAVEVKSPTDTKRELRMKAEAYIRYGTAGVWLIYPEEQTAEVYVADLSIEPLHLSLGDTLDGGDVLPNFRLPLAHIFRE